MKSYDVVSFGGDLAETERPTPEPTGSEILLRVVAAGVCHSDLHIRHGYQELGGGKRISYADRGLKLPLTMGHETVGEVLSCGPEVTGVSVGDTYLIYGAAGCGTCENCAIGEEQLCPQPRAFGMFRPGGYADHILVPHPRYLFSIDGLDPMQVAPLACAGITAYGALKKLGGSIGKQPIVIFGAGGLGLACLSLLIAQGGSAIVVDIDPVKLDAARSAGAIATVDGRAPDAADQVIAAAGGRLRAMIDFVGVTSTVSLALDCLTKGGKLVVVGLIGGEILLSIPSFVSRALTLQASLMGSLTEQQELIEFVQARSLTLMPTETRPLSEANQALNDLENGMVAGRIVLAP